MSAKETRHRQSSGEEFGEFSNIQRRGTKWRGTNDDGTYSGVEYYVPRRDKEGRGYYYPGELLSRYVQPGQGSYFFIASGILSIIILNSDVKNVSSLLSFWKINFLASKSEVLSSPNHP